jgi:glycosyltransferase involved in cell wall biosynthesis
MSAEAERDAVATRPPRAVSVVIPAFDEEGAIEVSIDQARSAMQGAGVEFEIIVVDDGSRDRTAELAAGKGARVVSHGRNRGYGAALKTGIGRARYDWIAITDADGTYPIHTLTDLVKHCGEHDMVVGARTGERLAVPLLRRPAKWFVNKLANYLSGYRIPDLNSGLRVFRREIAERFAHLFPDGFSFTTTITVAALSSGYQVRFVPIDYFRRIGKSSISPLRDFFGFALLVVRLVTYFKPLNVFLPVALFLVVVGLSKAMIDFWRTNAFGVGSSLVIATGVQVGFMGLLADLILRRTKL